MAARLEDATSGLIGRDLRAVDRGVADVCVELTPEGKVQVVRRAPSNGLLMTLEEFHACINTIQTQMDRDPIDVNNSPEEIVRGYLIKYCEEARSKLHFFKPGQLPTFKKAESHYFKKA